MKKIHFLVLNISILALSAFAQEYHDCGLSFDFQANSSQIEIPQDPMLLQLMHTLKIHHKKNFHRYSPLIPKYYTVLKNITAIFPNPLSENEQELQMNVFYAPMAVELLQEFFDKNKQKFAVSLTQEEEQDYHMLYQGLEIDNLLSFELFKKLTFYSLTSMDEVQNQFFEYLKNKFLNINY